MTLGPRDGVRAFTRERNHLAFLHTNARHRPSMGSARTRAFVAFISALIVAKNVGGAPMDARALVPGVALRREVLAFARGHIGNTYAIVNASALMSYEVKVSFTAANPARVWITHGEDDDREEGDARATTSARERNELRRRLLNVEKIVLRREFLSAREGRRVFVTVRAEREGVYWQGDAGAPKTLVYDIALGPLLASGRFGEIPRESAPVIALACGCVLLAIVIAPFVANRVIWRACDDERRGKKP